MAAQELPARARRMLRRIVRAGLYSLLALALAAALGVFALWLWSASAHSLASTLRLVQTHLPEGMQLQVQGVSGTLRQGGHIERLVWRSRGLEADGYQGGELVLTIEQADLRWQWSLWQRSIRIDSAQLRTVGVQDGRIAAARAKPVQPLESLSLPVDVALSFAVDALHMGTAPQANTLAAIKGSYDYARSTQLHRFSLASLHVAQGRYQLQAQMQAVAPMRTHIELQGDIDAPASPAAQGAAAQSLHASAQIQGTLGGIDALLHVQAKVWPQGPDASRLAQGTRMALQAQAHPWRPQPLLRAHAQWQQLNVQSFLASLPRTQLQGSFDWTPLEAATESIPPEEPHDALAQIPWQGVLRVRNDASGAWDKGLLPVHSIDVQASYRDAVLDLSRIGLLGTNATALQGSARYDTRTQAAQADVQLRLPGSQASLKGHIAASSGAGTLHIEASDLQKTSLYLQACCGMGVLRQLAASGRAQMQAQWSGGWHNEGRDLHIRAQLNAPALSLRRSAQTPQRVDISQAQVAVQGTLAQASFSAQARARQDQRQAALTLRGTAGQRPAGWHLEIQGTQLQLKEQGVQWQAALARPVALDFERSSGGAQLRTSAMQLDLGAAAQAQAQILIEPLHWAQQGASHRLSSKGRLVALPLSWVDALTGGALSANGLAGDVTLAGQWDVELGEAMRVQMQLQRSAGDLVLMAGQAGQRVAAGISEARIQLQSQGAQLHAALLWESARAGRASAKISTELTRNAQGWTLQPSAALRGSVRAQLPRLGLWSLFAPPGWRLRGTLDADLSLGGSLQAPLLQGSLNADDLGVRSVVDGIAFGHGKLRTHLSGQRLEIDEFSLQGAPGRGEAGTARITGSVAWDQGAAGQSALQGLRVALAADLRQLQISSMEQRQIALSGHINADLSGQQLKLRGALAIDRALIELPADIAPSLDADVVIRASARHPQAVLAQPQQAASAPQGAHASEMVADVQIGIDMGEDVRVRGRGLDTRLRGQLTVANGSTLRAMPRLSGAIFTDRGTFRAYGQELDIRSGRISFDGAPDNPLLDISAVRPHLGITVGARIRGRAQQPWVALFSDPAMPDSEKLAWLVLGRSANGAADAALLQQAALALLAGDGRGLAGELADALGLDELSVRGGADGKVADSSLILGKRFSRKFYVSYERGLDATLGTLYFFYDLNRRLKLRAQTGQQSAIDLIYDISHD